MIVFGIDPGSVNCGWGAIKYEKNKFTLLEYGVVKLKKMEDDFPKRIDILFRKLSSKIHEYKADIVCIETVFNAKNTQSLIKLTHARAAAMLAGTTNNAEISELSPNEVKKSVTGRGHASKEQVQFIFGTALIQDPFRQSRWDYFNSVTVGEKVVTENKLTIFFNENDLVESWIIEKSEPETN